MRCAEAAGVAFGEVSVIAGEAASSQASGASRTDATSPTLPGL